MNSYEAKQAARRERYEQLAEKAREQSESAFNRSRGAVEGIPMGQPILVGHHSERRHRNALKRSDNAMRAAIEADKKAAHYDRKADGVGRAGISSDDPEAVAKLKRKLEGMELAQSQMKAANAAWRRQGKPKANGDDEKWFALGERTSPEFAAQLRADMARDFIHRAPYTYALSNNSANMKRVKDRIAQLASAPAEAKESIHDGIKIVHAPDDNRIRIIFEGKPPAETRAILKKYGFRWSRYNLAWQRHLNNAGIHAAEQTIKAIQRGEDNDL